VADLHLLLCEVAGYLLRPPTGPDPYGFDLIRNLCWRSMDGVGSSGLRLESIEAVLLVASQPVVEGSSGDLGGGADLTGRNPLPMSSHAPALQPCNVTFFFHLSTLRILASSSVQYVM